MLSDATLGRLIVAAAIAGFILFTLATLAGPFTAAPIPRERAAQALADLAAGAPQPEPWSARRWPAYLMTVTTATALLGVTLGATGLLTFTALVLIQAQP
ncbi:hypothetical protein CXG81DRAFT_24213 [Caulochytrium protostelioides]|uniref:Uncharacterized protein n=1 Tax=Caulochytrium protostelioides TaxID=1555241 RepID=A0A4P9XCM8_9FUNG|nr:hypothetical protein CXG81DRAFT_24213 [Caulochytrium protostelioides]|eukprot:RKP03214.1 hypothetical protein CXG81DRAFT_24213 [Caulochytrium protostelioides]